MKWASLAAYWSDFVDHCGGETEADVRLGELMCMDMAQAMPDQVAEVDVSSHLDLDEIEEMRENVLGHFGEEPAGGVVQANLIIGKVPVGASHPDAST